MALLIVFLFCVIAALIAGVFSGWSDFKGLTIPNLYPAIIAGLFIPAYFVAEAQEIAVFSPLKAHLIAALAVFVITFIMFQMRMMGGGDSKLLTAYALWVALPGLPALLLVMAVAGLLVGMSAVLIQKAKPFKAPPEKSWIGRLQAGENSVPYGIPISLGAVFAFVEVGYLAPENWQAFLQ